MTWLAWQGDNAVAGQNTDMGELSDGSLHYVVKKDGNDLLLSYQEPRGAPVETNSPLRYSMQSMSDCNHSPTMVGPKPVAV